MAKQQKTPEEKAAAAAKAAEQAEEGATVLVAPEDCTSFSIAGEEYEVNDDGLVEVPDEVAAELISHGFKKAK